MLTGVLIFLFAGLTGLVVLFWVGGERGRLHSSTWEFVRASGFGLRTLHGYIYARWTRQYVWALFRLTPAGGPPTKGEKWLVERYHGKVLTPENAAEIVKLDKRVPLQDLEQVVPYPAARNILLEAPVDIVAYECVCRHNRAEHCTPTQVCMVIGRPMTDFVLEHHPDSARRLTRQEALELLKEEHERGHVHTAWFKDAIFGRFYAICNCCKCCCGGIAMTTGRGVRMLASSGYVAELDKAVCAECGDCVDSCPFGAIVRNAACTTVDWNRCMGCGVCVARCAAGAARLVRDERKGIPLDVRALAGAG